MIRTRQRAAYQTIPLIERVDQAKALLSWICGAAASGMSRSVRELQSFELEVQRMLECLFFEDVMVLAQFTTPLQDEVFLEVGLNIGNGSTLYVPVQFRLKP